MLRTKVVVLFGNSGSGKSTCAEFMKERYGYIHTPCIGHIKRYYEKIYKLPPRALDTYEGKAIIPAGMTCSLGQMLEKLYHFWAEVDPCHSVRGLEDILCDLIENNLNVVIEGVRNPAEVELIDHLKERYPDIILLKVWIIGDNRERKKDTDIFQEKLYSILKADDSRFIKNEYNNTTFEQLIPFIL